MSEFTNIQSKVKLYAQIQTDLCALDPKSTDEEISSLIQKIPLTFFDEKDNLIMLCQSIAMRGRYDRQIGRITIKLFENIMDYIKRDLQDESSLMWQIFGACSYFKYWLYKEGLIDLEEILQSAQNEKLQYTAQYFLPEIIENDPDFFHTAIKPKFECFSTEDSYSKQTIDDLKILREKHLKWLKESNDYHAEIYKEIEKDPIRLAIKTDDIETFQHLLSRSNLSVDSVISESLVERFLRQDVDMHYIDFAAKYNSMNIFKFLLLNGAKIEPLILNFVVHWDNYDMLHAIESKLSFSFVMNSLSFAIESWNSDFINYVIEKYDFGYLVQNDDDENDEEEENKEKKNHKIDYDYYQLNKIIDETFYCYNMMFMDSILLPFLIKEKFFVQNFFDTLLPMTFQDSSSFSTDLLLNFPSINKDKVLEKISDRVLINAIDFNNSRALEKFLGKNIDININQVAIYACGSLASIKIIKFICQHKDFNIKYRHPKHNFTIVHISLARGHYFALKYFIQIFPDEIGFDFADEICIAFQEKKLASLACFIKFLFSKYGKEKFHEIMDDNKKHYKKEHINNNTVLQIEKFINEIISKNIE